MRIPTGPTLDYANHLQRVNPQPTPKQRQTAREFEAVMMSILVSNMRKSSFGDGLFPGDKSDTLGGMFDMMVSDQMASSGGIGLEPMIATWLAKAKAKPNARG